MKNKEAFKVGLGAFTLLVIIGSLLIWKSNILMRTSAFELIGEFNRVNGLLKGGEIRYRGYKVGTVSKILPMPKHVRVHFFVKEGVLIPKDSELKVVFDGLIGEKYVSIRPNANTTDIAEPGDTLYGHSNAGLADFVDVAAQNLENTKEIVVSLKDIIASEDVSKALKNMVLQFEKITADLSQIMELTKDASVKGFGKNIASVATDLSEISAGIKEMMGEARDKELVAKIDTLITNLASLSGEIYDPNSDKKGMVGNFKRIGNVLSTLKLKSSVKSDYFYNQKEYVFSGNIDFQLNKKYLRFGIGNRLGSFQLLHLQQGVSLFDNLTGRVGILYNEPGFGFDYEFWNLFGVSLDVYSTKDTLIDITGIYKVTDTFDLSGTLMKNKTTGKFDNYSLGLSYHP